MDYANEKGLSHLDWSKQLYLLQSNFCKLLSFPLIKLKFYDGQVATPALEKNNLLVPYMYSNTHPNSRETVPLTPY